MEDINKEESAATENVAADQQEQKDPGTVLLGSIAYSNLDDYNKFLDKMDINQSLFVLIAGCTFAQTKGAYSLSEAELVAKAIKTIKGNAKPAEGSKDEPAKDVEPGQVSSRI